MASIPSLHPLIDHGLTKGSDDFQGGTLRCHCTANPVEVEIKGNVLHNHACGCSKCWKPKGALLAVIGVVPKDNVKVVANENKIKVVDDSATIQRHACSECGVHVYGRIFKDHPFTGLDFVHAELSNEKGWQEPQFAAFVSSLIEQGQPPKTMDEIRSKLKSLGLEPYDCLSPPLMDAIATYTARQAGTLKE